MSGGDVLFYVFAIVAAGGGLASSLSCDLRRAVGWLLACGVGVAGLLALANAAYVAGLLGVLVVTSFLLMRRRTQGGSRVQAGEASASAAGIDGAEGFVRNVEHVETEGAAPQPAAGTPAAPDAIALASVGRVRAALLVLAFFVIALRAVLIVRWPLLAVPTSAPGTAASVAWIPAVSLPHYLVTVLVLFCVGVFAAVTRRSASGIGMGIALMHAAVAVGLCAAARFVGGGSDMEALAVTAVVVATIAAVTTYVADSREGSVARESEAAGVVATTFATVLGGVTLALLAGAW